MKDIMISEEIYEAEEIAVEMADCGANAMTASYDEVVCGGPIPTM